MAGGRHREEGPGEAGNKASPLLVKELRSQTEGKRISPLSLRVFSLSLKMMLERKRRSWKGTLKKVRFLPRELKRFKSQCKSAVNAFGRNTLPLGTGNWPADTVNYSQGKKTYCKEGHKLKRNSMTFLPSAFLIHTFTFFWNTATHLQNAIFPRKLFLITGMTV